MTEWTLRVEGMTCGGCERSVVRALSPAPGVSTIRADFRSGEVVIETDGTTSRDELQRRIEAAGYEMRLT